VREQNVPGVTDKLELNLWSIASKAKREGELLALPEFVKVVSDRDAGPV
jgi:hypothetical protein